MSEGLRLLFEPESLTRTSLGTVSGRIWVSLDGHVFPEEGWYDLVLSLVDGWLEGLLRLFDTRTGKASLHFLDGPFRVELHMASDGSWLASLIDARSSPISVLDLPIDLHLFCANVLDVAKSVLEECSRRHWESESLESVATRVQDLKTFFKSSM